MEEAVNKVLNRNLELAQNVLSALKEARIKSSTDRPAWTVILSEAALLTSREFELPETRDIMDLDSEAKSFAWSLYYCFLESLTAVYKLQADLSVPLQNASVNSLEPYLSLLECHREDLEKTMLAEKEADIKPMAVISCNGRPLKILYVDSFAAYKDEYISVDCKVTGGNIQDITYSRTARMHSATNPFAEIARNLTDGMGREVFLAENPDKLIQAKLPLTYEFNRQTTTAPKNLRYGPAVRGTKGKIRNW